MSFTKMGAIYQDISLMFDSLTKQTTFHDATTGFPHEMTSEE